jgi:hypothetical protein
MKKYINAMLCAFIVLIIFEAIKYVFNIKYNVDFIEGWICCSVFDAVYNS